MTIAACYLTHEGLVLGADSTTTMRRPDPAVADHHCNYGQKIFEVGEGGTLALNMWGMGSLPGLSYRTMVADLSDDIQVNPPASVLEVADRWSQRFWREYRSQFTGPIARFTDLRRIAPRTQAEEKEFRNIGQLSGGFCIGGRVPADRTPSAFEIIYGPWMPGPESPRPIEYCVPRFWGCENLIHRLLLGIDEKLYRDILGSENWKGTPAELGALIKPGILLVPENLPMREAIDWIYSSIYITIKAFKFSWLSPVCGGPIEVAVITTDRAFRWVSHKSLNEALVHPSPPHRRETVK